MTTIAFDGKILAADMLGVDHYGLKSTLHKIMQNSEFAAGLAGSTAQQIKWWKETERMPLDEVLDYGYPTFEKEKDDPAIMLICRDTLKIWRHTDGVFCAHHGKKFAIGSGRDYALAAMYLDQSAKRAVQTAAYFDVYTSTDVIEVEV